jgi:hypothetical protein
MATFLGSIGIEIRAGAIDAPTLFPGSLISGGSLVVDESILVAPGDALHEAAHIALAPPERRSVDAGLLEAATGGEEMTTTAWSGSRCRNSAWSRRMSSMASPTRAATHLTSSIAHTVGSTSAFGSSRHGRWHSTSGMQPYVA